VFLVKNTSVVYGNSNLIFSTLWSIKSPVHQFHIGKGMNGFHVIKSKGYYISPEKYSELYQKSLAFFKDELRSEKRENMAAFTHHCPTFLNYPELY
jgi:hypothetical protein